MSGDRTLREFTVFSAKQVLEAGGESDRKLFICYEGKYYELAHVTRQPEATRLVGMTLISRASVS